MDQQRPENGYKCKTRTSVGTVAFFQVFGQSRDAALKIKGSENQPQDD